ncbi:MAG: hypothetical protein ACI4QL_04620, partial [Candidatus Fimimonas sp.]
MKKKSVNIGKAVTYTLLIMISAVMLLPLIILFATSFRTYEDILLHPSSLFGSTFSLESFSKVLNDNPYFLYLGNTLLITVVSILGCCLTSAFVAYGFTRFKVPGAGLIFAIFMSGMIIPGQVLNI